MDILTDEDWPRQPLIRVAIKLGLTEIIKEKDPNIILIKKQLEQIRLSPQEAAFHLLDQARKLVPPEKADPLAK